MPRKTPAVDQRISGATMNGTKERERASQAASLAAEIAARENVRPFDPPTGPALYRITCEIRERSGCSLDAARGAWARCMRRMRYPGAQRGGVRAGAGRKPKDFSAEISSGIGIGGAGSDDHNIASENFASSIPGHQGRCGSGQRYDESCAGCGRVTAICNDCELCEKCH